MTELKKFSFLHDIRFWILIFFIIRMAGITNPPLEVAHNWRQSTVAMVARNFYEVDNNILYPRIDIWGETTGITGMEFPLLNYMHYAVAEVFGYQHWYGRLINLIISSIGIFFFYRLIRKYFSERTAFSSALILLVSIWLSYSRKIMPDTFSMSLIIMSIYYGSNYLDGNQKRVMNLILFVVFFALGALTKITSAYLMIVFALWIFSPKTDFHKKATFIAVGLLGLLPVSAWYFYWVPYLMETYGVKHFFMGKDFLTGISEVFGDFPRFLNLFYEWTLKFVGFALFLLGIWYAIRQKQRAVLWLLFLTFLAFMVVAFRAGETFLHHVYYMIPFAPVMAFIAGFGLSKIPNRTLATVLLAAVAVEGVANQWGDYRIKEESRFLINIETDLDQWISRDDLIIINSNYIPTPMYFTHRKGRVMDNQRIRGRREMQNFYDMGYRYILILKHSFGSDMELPRFELITDNEDYRLYRIINDKTLE